MDLLATLNAKGVTLPTPPPPAADYDPVARHGRQLWVSGQLPFDDDGRLLATGTVGGAVDLETARRCAQRCVVNALAVLQRELDGGAGPGFARVIKVGVFVASAPGFAEQHLVADGASGWLTAMLGDAGRHARAAVGCASLPLDAPVEVELVVGLTDPATEPSSDAGAEPGR
ncbi:MAG: RidA family protein [Planctomycetota bacterium]